MARMGGSYKGESDGWPEGVIPDSGGRGGKRTRNDVENASSPSYDGECNLATRALLGDSCGTDNSDLLSPDEGGWHQDDNFSGDMAINPYADISDKLTDGRG